MLEGLTEFEAADYSDLLRRRGKGWPEVPPARPSPPWAILSGFPDRVYFASALARSWPLFPLTGDVRMLLKIFDYSMPVIFMDRLTRAIPSDELSLQ
jgi:hypothetical protein